MTHAHTQNQDGTSQEHRPAYFKKKLKKTKKNTGGEGIEWEGNAYIPQCGCTTRPRCSIYSVASRGPSLSRRTLFWRCICHIIIIHIYTYMSHHHTHICHIIIHIYVTSSYTYMSHHHTHIYIYKDLKTSQRAALLKVCIYVYRQIDRQTDR